MKDYVKTWLHGEETTQRTQQISARVENETVAYIEQLMATFGISKTEAIQGALDTGLKDLLHQAERIFNNDDMTPEELFLHNEARAQYEEDERNFEESQENK